VPIRAKYIRVMFDEITRILNTAVAGRDGLESADDVFLYCFASART